MNDVRKTLVESQLGGGTVYISPKVEVVLFQPEGILCSSVYGVDNEAFSEGGSYEI